MNNKLVLIIGICFGILLISFLSFTELDNFEEENVHDSIFKIVKTGNNNLFELKGFVENKNYQTCKEDSFSNEECINLIKTLGDIN